MASNTKIPVEMDFNLDSFNNQKMYKGTMAIAHRIKNLLFLKPGDLPSMPDAGINIQGYRFQSIDAILSGELKEKLSDQITKYITDIPSDNINIDLSQYNGEYYLLIRFSLYQTNQDIIFGMAQSKNDIVNFNFKIYDSKKVDIW